MFGIKKDNFSELSSLGDLSKYSLQALSGLIKKLDKEEWVVNQINYVKWSNKREVYILEYDLEGKFIKINWEEWLNPEWTINTNLREKLKKHSL